MYVCMCVRAWVAVLNHLFLGLPVIRHLRKCKPYSSLDPSNWYDLTFSITLLSL